MSEGTNVLEKITNQKLLAAPKQTTTPTTSQTKAEVIENVPDKAHHNFLINPAYSPSEFAEKVEQYFIDGGTEREVILGQGANKYTKTIMIFTLTGLTLYLGLNDKKDLFNLERNVRYREVIKNARTRIERVYEENLQTTGNSANIFALKNFGWVDKQEITHEVQTIKLDV